ncbi:MAG TPA: phosphate ABC transporter ATP-binding protein [Verrucomicrobiae bacterium]|nr:phosphate ABC transporter ATP-binding protein [Verrucomicrobiae bacterium]
MTVEELRVRFGAREVLHGISTAFAPRRITALIGPTGCGKTTLLRSLNRLHDGRPGAQISGSVRLGVEEVYGTRVNVRDLRRRIGMLFQRPNPFPQSIRENVSLAARIHGLWSRAETPRRTEAVLREVGLWDAVGDRLSSAPFSLSGGQQQLLCLARALAVEPEVLLLDEPTSSLDPRTTGRIEELIGSLREHMTIVIVTHNLQQAARVADDVCFLLDGSLVERAPATEFFQRPADERSRAYVEGRVG